MTVVGMAMACWMRCWRWPKPRTARVSGTASRRCTGNGGGTPGLAVTLPVSLQPELQRGRDVRMRAVRQRDHSRLHRFTFREVRDITG